MRRPLLAATALAAADAFAGVGPRIGVSPPAGLSAPLHAAGGPEGRGDGPAKSMFDGVFQNLQFPWDDPIPPKSPPPLKSRMAELLGEKGAEPPRRKKKPRAPRHPSALHEFHQGDTSEGDINRRVAEGTSNNKDINIHGSKANVDEYVRSAEEAVQSVRANGDKTDDKREMSADKSDAAEDIIPERSRKNTMPLTPKLGILLVDHGSKREASNAHLESIAESYQSSFDALHNESGEASHAKANAKVTVRAAHMEIAEPSILSTLRRLIVDDQVTRVVCVPYFLSPGKHATIDVPNLIAEAIDVLDSEGLLDYTRWNDDSEGDGRKEGRIEIVSSAALGTNVDRMLGVVDGLVRNKLDEDGGGDAFQLGPRGASDINGGGSTVSDDHNSVKEETEKELRKYANRAALLENMLDKKAKQLKTVTNRATLMEDALGRLQGKMQRERKESAKQLNEEGRRWEAKVANATDVLEAMGGEKAALEEQVAVLERQLTDAETGHNATLVDMEAKLAATEREVQRLRDERDTERLQAEQSEDDGEDLRQEVEGRQRRIDELQRQLAELLDAHAELEELQEDTEASVGRYRERLQEAEANHTEAMEVERIEKEEYRSKWVDAQQHLEAEANRTQVGLGESTAKYEALLEEERGTSEKWRGQCEALEEELINVRNATLLANNATITDAAARTEEEWSNLRDEVSNAKAANASAAERVQRLELQLHRQKEDHEASTAKKEEQQEQLQKYLRAQLSTYYDTIQDQTSQIEELQSQMNSMQQKHNDSMLIATNSVEASLRREEELLTSVEELEAALVGATAGRDRGSLRLAEAQLRLDALEGTVAAVQSNEEEASSSQADLERRNEDLRGELERLRGEVQRASEEKERAAMAGDPGETPRGQRRQWLRRAILRPWTLFRRREADRGR
ncbi:hypothetical protein ACHAXT_011825 [Thalassiosira profunda]